MPVSRMRMRPWLERVIDSQKISGLSWMDEEKTMFSIPWKHAARHGWELEKDASLFKMWAIHTGKYVEGQNCDPKTWKANFRCAMNSLPDIEEVKGKSINKGHQAVRVFRMLPTSPKSKAKQSKGKDSKRRRKSAVIKMEEEEEVEYNNTQSPVTSEASSSTQENTVDSTVNTDRRDIPMLSLPDVPDWSNLVEITDYKSSFHKLEVSPEHMHDYDMDIIRICSELENESSVSPGSPWSDSSSGEDSDEMPKYTTLNSGYQPLRDPWAGFFKDLSI